MQLGRLQLSPKIESGCGRPLEWNGAVGEGELHFREIVRDRVRQYHSFKIPVIYLGNGLHPQ